MHGLDASCDAVLTTNAGEAVAQSDGANVGGTFPEDYRSVAAHNANCRQSFGCCNVDGYNTATRAIRMMTKFRLNP